MKKQEFQWRYQIPEQQPSRILLSHIQNSKLHPSISKTKMILEALSAYYMPLAYVKEEEDPKIIRQIAFDSVFALQRQIDRLVKQFKLDNDETRVETSKNQVNSYFEQDVIIAENHQQEKFDATAIMGLSSSCPEE